MNIPPYKDFNNAFAITPSDTLDIKDDIGNKEGVQSVYLHNVAAGGTVRVMPAATITPKGFTLTGTSGTANITINGTAYLATFSSSLTTTATNFVTTHRATLAALGVVVSSNGAQLRFTGSIGGTFSIANATGDLNGTALAATPVTIYIPQGGTSEIAVRRVYATSPSAPLGLVGYYTGSKC